MGVSAVNIDERFDAKFTAGPSDSCWPWNGAMTSNGYGSFFLRKVNGITRTTTAHRFAYERANGPVPAGMHIDHLCRSRSCVNPNHLEAVTPAENTRRGERGVLHTHCPRGHELSDDNLKYRSDGRRGCAACVPYYNAIKSSACVECGTPVRKRSKRCTACHLRYARSKRTCA